MKAEAITRSFHDGEDDGDIGVDTRREGAVLFPNRQARLECKMTI